MADSETKQQDSENEQTHSQEKQEPDQKQESEQKQESQDDKNDDVKDNQSALSNQHHQTTKVPLYPPFPSSSRVSHFPSLFTDPHTSLHTMGYLTPRPNRPPASLVTGSDVTSSIVTTTTTAEVQDVRKDKIFENYNRKRRDKTKTNSRQSSNNVGDSTMSDLSSVNDSIASTQDNRSRREFTNGHRRQSQDKIVPKDTKDTSDDNDRHYNKDQTSTANTSMASAAVHSEKSKSSHTSKVFLALGLDACINDITPDPGSPDQNLIEDVQSIEEDSFYDDEGRGEEVEDGGVAVPVSMPAGTSINFATPPSVTHMDSSSHTSVREPPLTMTMKITPNTEVSHCSSTSESDYETSCSSHITSVKEDIESNCDEGDEETRGELAPESPRTPVLEDDNRAYEHVAENVKTMAHPGSLQKGKPNQQSQFFQEQQKNQSNGMDAITRDRPSERPRSYSKTKGSESQAGEGKHVIGRSSRPCISRGVSRNSEISEHLDSYEQSFTTLSKESTGVLIRSPNDIDRPPSIADLGTAVEKIGICSTSAFDNNDDVVSCSMKSNEDPFPPNAKYKEPSEIQTVSVLTEREEDAIEPKADDLRRSNCAMKEQDVSVNNKIKMTPEEVKVSTDLHQTLSFDFHQAQMDFDINVDGKTESVFKDKEKECENPNVTDPNAHDVDQLYTSSEKRFIKMMGKRREISKPTIEPGNATMLHHKPGPATSNARKDTKDQDHALTGHGIMSQSKDLDNQSYEDLPRGDEVIPKVSPYHRHLDKKKVESGSDANHEITQNESAGLEENTCNTLGDDKNNDFESVVDDFDEFNSRHLAMFQNYSEKQTEDAQRRSKARPLANGSYRKPFQQHTEGKECTSDVNDDVMGRKMLQASRPISRSATDLRSSMGELRLWQDRKQRPNTTQTLARLGGNETTEEHANVKSEETKNSQPQETGNTKGAENVNTKSNTKSNNEPEESPKQQTKGNESGDNLGHKGTKSPRKEGEKYTKTSETKTSQAAKTSNSNTPQKGGASKGGDNNRKQDEGTGSRDNAAKTKGTKGGKTEENNNEDKSPEKSSGKDANRGDDTSRSNSNSNTGELSDGRTKQKEFFKTELQRLETSLKRESSKIIAPSKKPHTPYIFNTLEPYYNTQITRFLFELPDEIKHGHTSRRTAQGLTDPWVDLRMDREILPKVASKPVSRQVAILKREKEIRDRKKRSAVSQSSSSRKEGSTRLPKFPVVHLETQDLATRQLFYSDVPYLRTELKNKYSSSARSKVDEDYKRTQQDFFRMELDKLDEVHPINRRHMRSAYFAYLQNTPGSKKAISDCVRNLKSGKAHLFRSTAFFYLLYLTMSFKTRPLSYCSEFELDPNPYSRFSRTKVITQSEDISSTLASEAISAFNTPRKRAQKEQLQQSPKQRSKFSVSRREATCLQKSPYRSKVHVDANGVEASKYSPRTKMDQHISPRMGSFGSSRGASLAYAWSPYSASSMKSPYAVKLPRSKRVALPQASNDKRTINSKKHRG